MLWVCAGIRDVLPLFDALPLCGAAPTFLCRLQRKVGKRKQLQTTRLTNIFSVRTAAIRNLYVGLGRPTCATLVLRASYEVLTGLVLQITHHLLGGFVRGDGGVKLLSFAYFSLQQQRKVGAAPHRGNASNRGNVTRMPAQQK